MVSVETKLLGQVGFLLGVPLLLWILPGVRTFFPLVILQILWGVTMGPSAFGIIWPTGFNFLFSEDARWALEGASFFGILIFAFFTGLHLDREGFYGKIANKHFWVISATSFTVPFAIGLAIAMLLYNVYPGVSGPQGNGVTFALTYGLCSAITALPVLSAILLETGQLRAPLGKFMLLCSTLHDFVLWMLVVFMVGLVRHPDYSSSWHPVVATGLVAIYLLIMFYIFAPLIRLIITTPFWQGLSATPSLIFLMFGLAASSLATDLIETDTLIGAVIYGALLPRTLRHFVAEHIELLNVALLLPLFFGFMGTRIHLERGVNLLTFWVYLGLMAATLGGQLIGTTFVSLVFCEHRWYTAFTLYAYMISKGVVELIMATILLDRGVISETAFTAIILQAVSCTVLTKPLVMLIHKLSGLSLAETHSFSESKDILPVILSPSKTSEPSLDTEPVEKTEEIFKPPIEGSAHFKKQEDETSKERTPIIGSPK